MTLPLPAWADAFSSDLRAALARQDAPFGGLDRASVFGDADGRGVTVAIVDSGVEAGHPVLAGHRIRQLRVDVTGDAATVVDDPEGQRPRRPWHGVRRDRRLGRARGRDRLAPDARCRQSGQGARARGRDRLGRSSQRIEVVNLSLSSRSEAMFAALHELADRSYFANTLLVCAANNVPGPSYPSLFARVVSVAAHDVPDPDTWFYNPSPPVEFGAYGVDVDVAWRDGGRIRATGNSFAAPHLAGQAARLRSRYPGATPVRDQGAAGRHGVGTGLGASQEGPDAPDQSDDRPAAPGGRW